MATIYLIRHGQASFGSANYDQLSELGQRQADATAEYLATVGIKLDAAYSGDLSRQRETCERALAGQVDGVPHHIDARFNEVNNDEQVAALAPVIMESNPALAELMSGGKPSSKDYQKIIEAVFTHWVTQDCSQYGIQTWEDYSSKAHSALREVMKQQGSGKTVGIFTSGGTIATLVAHVLGVSGEKVYRFYEPIFNCSVTQLFYSGDNVSLSYFNDRSFLQMLSLEKGENLVTYR
ncbi:histidine phosphatase family protein [Halioglobus sp. HI00S01]|uniref:histidine phosphatase family protein n=1 Tax=Halioglobus sp. HI00S01 TaxID=1822214 RepID=UPI0007C342A3|nr:histidine phosphatase family protein [Halioglobus sp. HI00S01]KZX55015.1 histidine phosphatase family protein [Halioglobus sp. HI00S01]